MTQNDTLTTAKPVGSSDFQIIAETDAHAPTIESLHESVFGPGRFARAAFRVREQGPYDAVLSFVAIDENQEILGSVRLTWVLTSNSGSRGLLLGPLCVQPSAQSRGIGRALVSHCVQAANATDASYVMLVGDQAYYGPQGFLTAPKGEVLMPGPVDLNRLLVCPLGGFDSSEMSGLVAHVDVFDV